MYVCFCYVSLVYEETITVLVTGWVADLYQAGAFLGLPVMQVAKAYLCDGHWLNAHNMLDLLASLCQLEKVVICHPVYVKAVNLHIFQFLPPN